MESDIGYLRLFLAVLKYKDKFPNYIYIEDLIDDIKDLLPIASMVDIMLEISLLTEKYTKIKVDTKSPLHACLYQINTAKYIAKRLKEKYEKE